MCVCMNVLVVHVQDARIVYTLPKYICVLRSTYYYARSSLYSDFFRVRLLRCKPLKCSLIYAFKLQNKQINIGLYQHFSISGIRQSQ